MQAIKNLDLSISRGEVFGFLGPNGSGKTTTIRMLLGLIAPSAGEIRLFGEVTTFGGPRPTGIGAAVERPAFYPHLDARENLRVFAAIAQERADRARIGELIATVGLEQATGRHVGGFSTGMRQRLALALALLRRPSVLILDEPTDGLDPLGIVDIRRLISALAEGGTTIFLSSHLLTEVERLCTRVAILVGGRVVREGATDDLVGTGIEVHLSFGGPADAAAARRALEGEGYVTILGQTPLDLLISATSADTAKIVLALDRNGSSPLTMSTKSRSLEDIYLDVAGSQP